jgi:hypothetical protein
MGTRRSISSYCLVSLLIAGVSTLSACGGGSSSSTTSPPQVASTSTPPKAAKSLALAISESGHTAKFTVPAEVTGGLVSAQLTNNGKGPHGAQLVRIVGNHAPIAALKTLGTSTKIPDWIHAEGGIGPVTPGSTVGAKVRLPAGKYLVVDLGGGGGGNGPPAYAQFTVLPGAPGALPSTPITITADNSGKDRYRWRISGTLHSGSNDVKFVSKGHATLHEISAVRITGNPSTAEILKALKSNGPPPSFVDQSTFGGTAVLDSGKSLVSDLRLAKPGKYLLLCHLTDRDGGKPHFAEGLLTRVTVK